MTDTRYAPVTDGDLVSVQALTPGVLAYIAGQKRPVLCISLFGKDLGLFELGGERAGTIWDASYEEGAAWTIPDWSLEVDPTSMMDGSFSGPKRGCAFRVGDRSGLVGVYQPDAMRSRLIAAGVDGLTPSLLGAETKVYFSRWRIVIPTPEGDQLLADDEGKAQLA